MDSGSLLKYFPPPKFLDIPYAGLSISDSAVRCIQFGKKSGVLYIEKYMETPLIPGTVVSGEVKDREKIVQVWSGLKKELNLSHVKISLPEEKGYLFTSRIPIVAPSEVQSVVESKIEESVPVPGSELTFDYKLVDHRDKGHLDIIVSAVPITVAGFFVDMALAAGLSPLSLEIESQAITRALLPEGSLGTVLVVNFSLNKAGLYVATDRIVRFTSTVPLKETAENSELLSQEIRKLYMYWHSLKENIERPEKKISRIFICGKNIPEGVAPYLSANNNTPASLGDVWTNVFDAKGSAPVIPFEDSLHYAAAVGLALPTSKLV